MLLGSCIILSIGIEAGLGNQMPCRLWKMPSLSLHRDEEMAQLVNACLAKDVGLTFSTHWEVEMGRSLGSLTRQLA